MMIRKDLLKDILWSDENLLHKSGRDGKIFHTLVVPSTSIEKILHQVDNVLGHNGTARTLSISETNLLLKGIMKRCSYSYENNF